MAKRSINDLSFVADRRDYKIELGQLPRCFWNVQATGDYRKDCDIGRRLALEYFEYEENNDFPILASIVSDMPRPLTGVEVGFLELVCLSTRAGAHEGRRISAYWDKCREEDAQTKKRSRDRIGRFAANSDLQSAG